MVYLIQVSDHNIQHNGNGSANVRLRDKFSDFLKKKVLDLNIVLIGEEFNEDALKGSKGNISTVKNIAEELKIKHRFCEPSIEERKLKNILSRSEILSKKLNIKIEKRLNESEQKILDEEQEKSFAAREEIWFEKIKDVLDKNIGFVCGLSHIQRFRLLLNNKGYKTEILVDSWEKN
jgi:hypothetical protein